MESWISVVLLGSSTILLRAKAAGRGTLPGWREAKADRGIERSHRHATFAVASCLVRDQDQPELPIGIREVISVLCPSDGSVKVPRRITTKGARIQTVE